MTTPLTAKPASVPRLDVDQVHEHLQRVDAVSVVRWAHETFGDGLIMTSSFGAQAAVMLHLATRVVPDIPVVLLDTGYLFPETYRFAEHLRERLNLNLHVYQPRITAARMKALYGRLWEDEGGGLDRYHQITKTEPMSRAIQDLNATAWLAGLRARQTDHRSSLRVVEQQDGVYKVHPILNWSTRDVHQYVKAHDLPYHPLYEKGYASIGDVHSTRPITAEDKHERATRFNGLRQECGLHVPSSQEEDASRMSSDL